MEPFDVEDLGWTEVLKDPTGAHFGVWQARSHTGTGIENEPGASFWVQLNTNDAAEGEAFYTTFFGWEAGAGSNVGVTCTEFRRGEVPFGGMLAMPPDAQAPPSRSTGRTEGAASRAKELSRFRRPRLSRQEAGSGLEHVPPRAPLLIGPGSSRSLAVDSAPRRHPPPAGSTRSSPLSARSSAPSTRPTRRPSARRSVRRAGRS